LPSRLASMDAAGTFTRYSRVLSPAMERVADSVGAFTDDSARVATPAGGAWIDARGGGPRERAARPRAARAVAARSIAGARQVCFDRRVPRGIRSSASHFGRVSFCDRRCCPSTFFGWRRDVGSSRQSPTARRMFRKTALAGALVLLALVSPTDAKAALKSCAADDTPVSLTEVELLPNPLRQGSLAKFNVAASSSLALEDGTISVNVKLGDTIIGREKIPLCDAIACPVAAGDVAIVYEKLFPEFVPPGVYTVQLKAENGGGAELFCADVRFNVAPGSKARERDMYQFDRRRNPRGVSKEIASRAGEGKFWDRSAIEDGRRELHRRRMQLEEERRERIKRFPWNSRKDRFRGRPSVKSEL